MAQTDDSTSLNAETPLKRKAISECRLQDPKLWSKISWIRTNFIKDLESGVRKTDFYNYVTEHLGKTGYRDVWHLLKMAYPHVDRVRRGRKYMYWGVRHADDQASFEKGDNGNNAEDEDEEKQDKDFSAEDGLLKMEIEIERVEDQVKESSSPEGPSEGKTPLSPDTQIPSGLVSVKLEKDPDINEPKPDDVVVIEFKDKEVFASFEDYEKSKQTADKKGNLITVKGKRTRGNKNKNETQRSTAVRSVSPPLEIFSFESLKDDDKNKILDLSSTSKDLHDNEEFKSDREDHQQTSLKDERCHGDSDNGAVALKEPEDGSVSNNQEGKVATLGDKPRGEFAPNLLHPENINRMCMPLIKDLGNKNTNKARPTNENNISDTSDQPSGIQDGNLTGLSADDSDLNGDEVAMGGQFPCHPLIVSVSSIANVEDSKRSSEPTSDEINNILKTPQLQACKSVTARLDDGTTRQSPSSPNHTSDDDAEFVVVQDRGIQVTEQVHTCIPHGKRGTKQINPSVGHKTHSPHNELGLKNILPANSTRTRSSIAGTKGQSVRNVFTSQDKPRVCGSEPLPRQDNNNVHGQPTRLAVSGSRNSQSESKAMGNVVRSEEPLMKALMKKPASYHALVAKNRNNPDMISQPAAPAQKRLLPKVVSPEVVSRPHQDRLSPKYTSPQNVVYGATSTIEHRPSLTLPHGQREKQLYDQNMNKTRSTNQLSSHTERHNGHRSPEDSSLRTRDFLRNLLSHHESKSPSSTNPPSTSDLQVTVECLSCELEKERTMRLRLEIELRKVENQLNEERKLNERLAAMLMKR